MKIMLSYDMMFICMCFLSLLKNFPGMPAQTAVRAEIIIDSGQ